MLAGTFLPIALKSAAASVPPVVSGYVQGTTGKFTTGGTAVAAVTTSAINTSNGSGFIVAATLDLANTSTMSITDSKGNTYVPAGALVTRGGDTGVQVFYCANGIGGTGHTFSTHPARNSAWMQICAHEVTGLAPVVDSYTSNATATTATATVNGVNPTNANNYVFIITLDYLGNGATYSAVNYNTRVATTAYFGTIDRLHAPTGSQSVAINCGVTTQTISIAAVFETVS